MIKEALEYIASNYLTAKEEAFGKHSIAQFLRTTAPKQIAKAISNPDLITAGSPGQGRWAILPWVAVFYPPVTTKASKGYYVVYLFSEDMSQVCLSLNQAVTPFSKEFSNKEAHNKLAEKWL